MKYIDNTTSRPISRESIDMLLTAHNVKIEKCELYRDFLKSFFKIVFDTYLGDDIMDDDGKKAHLDWCWKKNQDNFKKEGIELGNEGVKDIVKTFMYNIFYPAQEKDEESPAYIQTYMFWDILFDVQNIKTNVDMDNFLNAYNLLDKSLKLL